MNTTQYKRVPMNSNSVLNRRIRNNTNFMIDNTLYRDDSSVLQKTGEWTSLEDINIQKDMPMHTDNTSRTSMVTSINLFDPKGNNSVFKEFVRRKAEQDRIADQNRRAFNTFNAQKYYNRYGMLLPNTRVNMRDFDKNYNRMSIMNLSPNSSSVSGLSLGQFSSIPQTSYLPAITPATISYMPYDAKYIKPSYYDTHGIGSRSIAEYTPSISNLHDIDYPRNQDYYSGFLSDYYTPSISRNHQLHIACSCLDCKVKNGTFY